MQFSFEIMDNIHWIGVNDRRKELFENLWPLPYGVSYNSYLIVDKKTALLDTIEMGTDGTYINKIETILRGKQLDYFIINHMEPDHSGEIGSLVRAYPDIKIVGNAKTFEMLRAYYGDISSNLMEVKDGETLELGEHTLKFVMTPWVHWPETMMTYEVTEQVLFSGDAFGTFGSIDGGVLDKHIKFEYYESEMRRYYSNIVGKYGGMVQRALKKLEGTPIKSICSLHGPVWQKNIEKVVSLYDKWSKGEADNAVVVIYASMYGNAASMADYIGHKLAEKGVWDVRVYDVSKTHPSHLISEIWRCKGVIMGSCAYNTGMLPTMQRLCDDMIGYGLKGRSLGLFGSCSWVGGGVKSLEKFAETIGWEQVATAVEVKGRPEYSTYVECDKLVAAMAESLK